MYYRNKLFLIAILLFPAFAKAESGYDLWLRYQGGQKATVTLAKGLRSTPTLDIARNELTQYWQGSETLTLERTPAGTKEEAYTLLRKDGHISLSSASDAGLLYAAYHLLRLQQTDALQTLSEGKALSLSPDNDVRILNHWDNPDGTVERGYAGKSLWKWEVIPAKKKAGKEVAWNQSASLRDRIRQYARANASLGINATVLNNVNAKPLMLTLDMMGKAASIADVVRPYGMRVYLAVNFGSPKAIGGLSTADPLDPAVIRWWKDKVDTLYSLIPDFGGFLVKANSEGEPGPMDYGRTHVDGANMLADALAPHGGIVMWRAFVYAPGSKDRASQAWEEFMPLDGKFRSNVTIQIKNGPIDFQPREAISPLLLSMRHTRVMPEFQITQEYTGHSIHTCFLAPMWKEFFHFRQMAFVPAQDKQDTRLLAGVANIGDDLNWCGNDLAQANWYAFGRLAWDESLSSEQIAREFLMQTFTSDTRFLDPMTALLLHSRETVTRYMMPLGLHHIFAGGHHYGPEPWYAPQGAREDWLPRYYHRADKQGIGFDRSRRGSGNTQQYPEPFRSLYDNLNTCPENLLLWFHHVSWDHLMSDGHTLWQSLCYHYEQGARDAEQFVKVWKDMQPYLDAERYEAMLWRFERQARDAWWWHDACILYFQQFAQRPVPADITPARFRLEDLMKYHLPIDNYRAPQASQLP